MDRSGSNRRRAGFSILAVIDFVLLILVLGVVMLTQLATSLRAVEPAVGFQHAFWYKRVSELCPGHQDLPSWPIGQPGDPISQIGVLAALPPAIESVWDSYRRCFEPIESAVNFEHTFWQQRISELCQRDFQLPPWPMGRAGDPISQIRTLAALRPEIEAVWAYYQQCLEPRTLIVHEDLLHFSVDRFDQFDDPTDRAYEVIMKNVEQNLATHSEIYIFGDTDERGSDEHNDLLSFRRALYVAGVIEQQLQQRGLLRGRDYNLYPVGRGKSALLRKEPDEDLESWYKRCRRIEISFRSPSRSPT